MKLVFPNGEHGQVFLNPGVNRIGSDIDNAVVLNRPGILPVHCVIHISGTGANLQVPQGAGPVTVNGKPVPDIMGLRPLFEEHCARISKEWKVSVCAPELFPGGDKWGLDQRMKKAKTLKDEDKVGDILAAAQRTGCDNVHVVGFCMGGMYALKAAAQERFTKAVSFYVRIKFPKQWKS